MKTDHVNHLRYSITRINPLWYLLVGIAAISASHMSFSIDMVGWIASVPFLLYLSVTEGWKARLVFVLALIAAWSLVVLKIITPPIPYVMIFLFSVPISVFHLPAYLIWDQFKKHKMAVLLFPAIFVMMEWIQYSFTPFASWGIAAYTQSHSLAAMQAVSIFGMAGLSFLIYWINSSIAQVVVDRNPSLVWWQLPAGILFIVLVFGSLRFDLGKSHGRETIPVAAVGTDSAVSGLPLPTSASNEKVVADLLARTRIASGAGAKLVVWNEGAFFALPEEEQTWMDTIKAVAKEWKVSLVASYVVPVTEKPLTYQNKYQFINGEGRVVYSYLKHQPVPGEPAMQGTEPLQVTHLSGSTVGGAICYDYDFPYLAQEFGKLKADIVAVPSSDWRGIDPLHTRMSAFRAIEQGHSIIRSTRFGLSAAISPYGEMVSQMSSFDKNTKIMMAHLPAHRIKTVYSMIGDTFVFVCLAFTIGFLMNVLIKGKQKTVSRQGKWHQIG